MFGRRLVRALSRNHAETAFNDIDPRLRGLTCAIPVEQVGQAARALADRGLRRWSLIDSDDYEGIIAAESRSLLGRSISDVSIRISLDHDAQTRVDMQARSRKGGVDMGANARRIGRFFRALDQRVSPPGHAGAKR